MRRFRTRRFAIERWSRFVWPLATVLIAGCAAGSRRADPHELFYAGDYAAARESLAAMGRRKSDAEVCRLNAAVVDLAAGRYPEAQRTLRQLRDRFDRSGKIDPVGDAASMALDDNARRFELSPEEQTLLRGLLAIGALVDQSDDAESYALQSTMHRAKLIRDHDLVAGRDVALVPYVGGVVRESNHRDYDTASRAYATVAAIMPTFDPTGSDIVRAGGGVHSPPGYGVLYVIAMTGRGPRLIDVEAETSTAALSMAAAVWSANMHATDDQDHAPGLPNIASVRVPAVHVPSSTTAAVAVTVGGRSMGQTRTVTDWEAIVRRRLADQMPAMMTRAILRRASKEVAVAATAKGLGLEGTAASMFQFAAASGWAATERADTRCWSMLPREFQIIRVELPVGRHQCEWFPINETGGRTGDGGRLDVQIEDGRNAYRLVVAP